MENDQKWHRIDALILQTRTQTLWHDETFLNEWERICIMDRASHVVVDLGWVDLELECSTVWPILRSLTVIWQNWLSRLARWWNTKIIVNPTKVYDHKGHPVHDTYRLPESLTVSVLLLCVSQYYVSRYPTCTTISLPKKLPICLPKDCSWCLHGVFSPYRSWMEVIRAGDSERCTNTGNAKTLCCTHLVCITQLESQD